MTKIKIGEQVNFFIKLAKTQAVMNRRFDSALGGLSLSEFIILYHLNQAPNESLRRIDLAEKLGLTASGVTRLLLPMEKIGLINSGDSEQDARVRCVILATGGRRKLVEALERAELLTGEITATVKKHELKNFSQLLSEIIGQIRNV